MAFRYIDDSAWPATDDAPLDAHALQRLRDNVEAIHDERRPRVGWSAPQGAEWRMCAVQPAAHGPFYIYLHPEERWASVDVRIRHTALVNADVHVWAGVMTSPSNYAKPPTDIAEWGATAAGHTFDSADAANAVSLTASVPGGHSGWTAVVIWVASEIDTTASAKGSGDDGTAMSSDGSILLGDDVVTATFTEWIDPPEVAIVFKQATLGSTELEVSDWLQVASFSDADNTVVTHPPAPRFDVTTIALAPEYESFLIGVLPVEGVSLEGTPVQFELDQRQFRTGRGVAEQNVGALVQAASRMANTRVRQFGCFPGIAAKETQQYGQYLNASTVTITNNQLMCASGLITPVPIESDGYRAIVSFYVVRQIPASSIAHPVNDLIWTLKAYDTALPTPGVDVENAANQVQEPPLLLPHSYRNGEDANYRAVAQNIALLRRGFPNNRLRGMHAFADFRASGRHDFDYLNTVELEIPETGINYPSILGVTVKAAEATHSHFHILVVGCGFASRSVNR